MSRTAEQTLHFSPAKVIGNVAVWPTNVTPHCALPLYQSEGGLIRTSMEFRAHLVLSKPQAISKSLVCSDLEQEDCKAEITAKECEWAPKQNICLAFNIVDGAPIVLRLRAEMQ